jgi:hypothetical protein
MALLVQSMHTPRKTVNVTFCHTSQFLHSLLAAVVLLLRCEHHLFILYHSYHPKAMDKRLLLPEQQHNLAVCVLLQGGIEN